MTAFFVICMTIFLALWIVLIMIYTLLTLTCNNNGDDCVLQHEFHVHHVEPAVEFVAYLFEVGDFLKSELLVEGHA